MNRHQQTALLTNLVEVEVLWNVQIHLMLELIPIIHDFYLFSLNFTNLSLFANPEIFQPIREPHENLMMKRTIRQ